MSRLQVGGAKDLDFLPHAKLKYLLVAPHSELQLQHVLMRHTDRYIKS
jgi:hypothetical protein